MFTRTSRLLLRPGWIEDAPALARAIDDAAIAKSLVRMPWPYKVEDAARYLTSQRDPVLPNLVILRRTLGAPQLIGSTGFARTNDGEVELGFWITRACWGLGFATEACRAMLDIARHALGLEEIVAASFTSNVAAHHVLAKLGFVPAGQTLLHCTARDALLPALRFRRPFKEGTNAWQARLAA